MASSRLLPPHWTMDPGKCTMPQIPGGINQDVVKILTWLKEYDDACLMARAQLIDKIDHLLGNEPYKQSQFKK